MSISLILALVKIIAFFPTRTIKKRQTRKETKEIQREREQARERQRERQFTMEHGSAVKQQQPASKPESRDGEAKKLPFKKNAKKLLPLHFARIIEAQWSVHTLIQNGGWPCTHTHTHKPQVSVCVCVYRKFECARLARALCTFFIGSRPGQELCRCCCCFCFSCCSCCCLPIVSPLAK